MEVHALVGRPLPANLLQLLIKESESPRSLNLIFRGIPLETSSLLGKSVEEGVGCGPFVVTGRMVMDGAHASYCPS